MSDNRIKCVLIMEDNKALATEWREVFELNQINVELSHDAEQALKLLQENKFDLVITDLFVKNGKGGLHVLAGLIKMGEDAPPAIAVTGSFVASHREEDSNLFLAQALRLGSSETLQKPFPSLELVVAARRLWDEGQ